ncbi:MAG: phosphatidylinositol-specific phospholipase C [Candidatus Fimenecus sp.]
MKKVISAIISAILIITIMMGFVLPCFSAKAVSGNNWMSAVSSSVKLTEINMPGTHDSCTQYVNASIISRTQTLSIPQQLQIGVRYFDMRYEKVENGFIAVHGAANCKVDGSVFADDLTASQVIADCKAFLAANPTETVLFQLKEDDGDAGTSFYSSFYDYYIKSNPDIWFIENRIPTLGEVRGKIVLLRAVSLDTSRFDDSNSGINFSQYPYIGDQTQFNYQHRDITKTDGTKYASMYVQDSYKLEGDAKWTCISSFLGSELNPNEFNICMTNCTRISTPQFNAQDINGRLKQYNFQKGKCYGIVAMDFVTDELCNTVVNTNSGVTVNTGGTSTTSAPPATSGSNSITPSSKPTTTAKANNESSTAPQSTQESVSNAEIEENTSISETVESSSQIGGEDSHQKGKISKVLIISVSAAAVLLLVGAGIAAYFITKKRK